MNPIIKNILAVIAGWLGGSLVNMGLVNAGPYIIPLPEGVDISSMEAMAATGHLFEPQNFIFPFLGHALGTLVGAFIAYKIAATHKMKFAYGIGGLFLLGGIMVSFMIPAPTWFNILDIAVAYIPMAWLGGKLAARING